MVHAVLTFPTNEERTKFFETSCLEKYGISENILNTKNACFIDNININRLAEIIKFARDNFNVGFHVSCGGNNLKDCSNYEKKHGSICNYCQYMEFG
jgi:hypothetical protein